MMVDTPYSAMSRFVQIREARPNVWPTDPNMTPEDALDEAWQLLRPFLLNPERHEKHVRAILTGLSLDTNFIVIRPITRFFDSRIGRAFLRFTPNQLRREREKFLQRFREAQVDLERSLTPVELDADMLPVRSKEEDGISPTLRLVVFPINVSLYKTEFEPQMLSVRLTVLEPDFQFVDVEPSSRSESLGTYEVGVSESGKFTDTLKRSSKVAFSLDGKVAKLAGDLSTERSSAEEHGYSTNTKQAAQEMRPAVISSAIKGTARWELLRTPSQPLLGGYRFFATAFVRQVRRKLPVELRVLADMDQWGPYEIVIRRDLEV
jgi:hypothetical protein